MAFCNRMSLKTVLITRNNSAFSTTIQKQEVIFQNFGIYCSFASDQCTLETWREKSSFLPLKPDSDSNFKKLPNLWVNIDYAQTGTFPERNWKIDLLERFKTLRDYTVWIICTSKNSLFLFFLNGSFLPNRTILIEKFLWMCLWPNNNELVMKTAIVYWKVLKTFFC